jgi:hypothetical protein
MSQGMTISDELPGGIEVDGVVHRDFTLRLPKVRDNADAIDEVGSSNALNLSAAIFARQLTKLGTLKPDQITFDLISEMHPEDYNFLEAKATELEKKRKAARSRSALPSSGSGSPSAAPG